MLCHSINKGQCVNVKLALKYDAVLRLNKNRRRFSIPPDQPFFQSRGFRNSDSFTTFNVATMTGRKAFWPNGIGLNGIGLNGIGLNGIRMNGIWLNGIGLNGIGPFVMWPNGIRKLPWTK